MRASRWLVRGAGSSVIDEAMIADLKAEGLTEDSLKKIEPLAGKKFDMAGVWAALWPILHADEVVSRKLKELATTGYVRPAVLDPSWSSILRSWATRPRATEGNTWLCFRPPDGRRPPFSPRTDSVKTDDFAEFPRMVQDLVPSASDSPKGGDGR